MLRLQIGIKHLSGYQSKVKLSQADPSLKAYMPKQSIYNIKKQYQTYLHILVKHHIRQQEKMERFYPKRRGPEWKQGWTSQTMASISPPPFHLLTIFAIVMLLLWLSQYTGYKAQLQQTAVNFQLFLLLLPVLLMFFMASYSTNWWSNFQLCYVQQETSMQPAMTRDSPWGVAIFVVLVLVLLSYQSAFHSMWFGPLRSSD